MRIIVGGSQYVDELANPNFVIDVPAEHIPAFKLLVARGANTWADAPREIKELHDLLYHGKILQKY